jgi:hypothetical protein
MRRGGIRNPRQTEPATADRLTSLLRRRFLLMDWLLTR